VAHNGLKVADSDMHVLEPADLWQRYMEERFAHAAPVGLDEIPRDMRLRIKSRVVLRSGVTHPRDVQKPGDVWRPEHQSAFARAEERGWDAQSQLDAMDAEQLDVTVLFPSRGLFALAIDSVNVLGPNDGLEPEYAAAIARAYNDWLHDFCQADPRRMYGAAMVAAHDVDSAVAEVRRCVQDYGFKAAFLNPGHVNLRPWHHASYDPLWAECERLGVPICFHGGGQTYLRPDYSLEVFDKLMLWHVFNQPLGIMAAAVSFTGGGVLERFPDLRVGLLEGNCSWAPWLMHRLDEHYEWLGALEAPDLTMKPSEYLRRSCFLSVEVDEDTCKHYVDWFGDDNLLFSTDYPHADCKYPSSLQYFFKLPLSEESQRKVLWDNFCRLYDFPLGYEP
jgi:predicted TIM-barrel fold metal-dependent hydrolase